MKGLVKMILTCDILLTVGIMTIADHGLERGFL